MNNITSLTLTALLLAASPTTLPAAQPVGDSIDVDGVMRVAARKVATSHADRALELFLRPPVRPPALPTAFTPKAIS